jgi:hypothetical protein
LQKLVINLESKEEVAKKLQRYVINIQRMKEAKNNELKEEVVKNCKENLSQEINNHPLSSILCDKNLEEPQIHPQIVETIEPKEIIISSNSPKSKE